MWKFLPDPFGEGETYGYPTPEYDTSRWQEVAVPGIFDQYNEGLRGYEGAGWFRTTVFVPKSWQGKAVRLHGEAANYHTKIWINGVAVGENQHGFLPFASDKSTTDAVRYGEFNTIVLCVDNIRRAGEVPGMERGWRPYGGILRSLWLEAEEAFSIIPVPSQEYPKRREDGSGEVALSLSVVTNGTEIAQAVVAELRIRDSQGQVVAEQRSEGLTITGESISHDFRLTVPAVAAWSPESPTLYTAEFRLWEGETVLDVCERRFGFRTIAVTGGRVQLNGSAVLFYGFNRHEDSNRSDMVADRETARQDLLRMKQMGANYVRLCHYPHDAQTLDLCDEIGLLVMAEIPLYWWRGNRIGEAAFQASQTAAEEQLQRLVARDFYHPSVVFWSVSNETEEQHDEVAAGNAHLIRFTRQLDPTRLVVHVSNHWLNREGDFSEDDVLCVNAYPTWGGHQWEKNPHIQPTEGATWWTENLNHLRETYPNKPILVTEFGFPAIAGVQNGSISEVQQAETLSKELSGILNCPAVCGATVWCWADHPWPEEPFINRITTSPFGVVRRNRERKVGLEVLERAFQGKSHRPSLVLRRANLENLPNLAALLPEGYILRTRNDDDLPSLTRLMVAAYPEITWSEEGVRDALITDETVKTTFVIECVGELVATASARWQPERYPDEGYVHWVASNPEHRGKRLGYITTAATLHEFAQWGAKGSILHTDDFRVPAIKVYLNLGFMPVLEHATHLSRWDRLRPQLTGYDLGL
jgi:beta-glucuronidase